MEENIHADDLIGIYGELAEIIGIDNVIIIYQHFKGQQVAFPTRLYTKDYILKQVENSRHEPIKKIATKFGYSERRLRQLINEKEAQDY